MCAEHERRGLLHGGNVKRPRQGIDVTSELGRAYLAAVDPVLILLADGRVPRMEVRVARASLA